MESFVGYWSDRHKGFRVMCEPVEGYVLARRKGAAPFVIHSMDLISGGHHHRFGPFKFIGKKRPSPTPTSDGGGK